MFDRFLKDRHALARQQNGPLTLVMLNIATLDPNPASEEATKTVEQHFYTDGKLDRIETYTRPDPEAPKTSPRAIRKDFYNPTQTQIQLRGGKD
jgi:hypothetical protein